jgi:hypothetical protein
LRLFLQILSTESAFCKSLTVFLKGLNDVEVKSDDVQIEQKYLMSVWAGRSATKGASL